MRGGTAGQVFAIESEISIGREPENTVCVMESAVSRRHCTIRREGASYILKDLGSRNATLVNGVAVSERLLEHGDQIMVGGATFQFRLMREEGRRMGEARHSTIVMRSQHSRYWRASDPSAELPATARTVRDLGVLLHFSQSINALREWKTVEKKMVESLAQVTGAERISILEAPELTPAVNWERGRGFVEEAEINTAVIEQVAEDRAAVISDEQERSLLVAPMELYGQLVGMICLDSCSQAAFDENHLHLVSALAAVAGLALENARRHEQLIEENRRLQEELTIQHDMVGTSASIKQVFQFIDRVAQREANVLIWGESGTGKELVARAIHRNSSRVEMPFVAINCAAITDTLLESELFGHEKGAFTGATALKKGKLEVADGGTVFLDEIGELAPALQAKLLRVLQEREFERVGGTRPIKLNIRLVAATNRNLKEASQKGTFREDLYYRLNVVSVRMPALRDRREDIPILANFFAKKFAEKVNRQVTGISPAARACLMQYDWPGNVRELENAIERAVVLGLTEEILPEDLPESMVEEAAPEGKAVTALHDGLREAKKKLIENAIDQAEGNYTEAAHRLGVHPNHLFRLIKSLGMKPKRGKGQSAR